ncbi:MAG: hypothetical protein ACXVB1_00155 [Pseudobdellovibrionaceae bacterium]
MEVKIEQSPYGDSGAIYHGHLGMFNHYLLQLKHFRKLNKTKEEREYLEADIRGYEAILHSNSEENALKFLEVKREARNAGKRFANNEKIVEHMKQAGLWKEVRYGK